MPRQHPPNCHERKGDQPINTIVITMEKIKITLFKSLLLLSVTSVLLFSCSTDEQDVIIKEEQQLKFTPKSLSSVNLQTAISLYQDMTLTTEYLNYKNALRAFNLKFNKNSQPFSNKADMAKWVKENIKKTSFTDMQQFEAMWAIAVNKGSIMKSANSTLYVFIRNANIHEIKLIFQPEWAHLQTNGIGCIAGCIAAAIIAYDQTDLALQEAYYNNNIANGGELGEASIERNFNMTYMSVAAQQVGCMAGCPQ